MPDRERYRVVGVLFSLWAILLFWMISEQVQVPKAVDSQLLNPRFWPFVLACLTALAIRVASKITKVSPKYLYPSILVFCIFGSYAVNSSSFDVLVMIIFGVLGYIFKRLEIPTALLLIGFILGPLLEDSFRQSIRISDGSLGIFFIATFASSFGSSLWLQSF
jgi:TctA family transporter